MSAKASRRLRTALVVVLILAALYAAYRYTLHRMVESRLDEIRKQGYPVTLAELDKWCPQPPPGENAAEVYRSAFAKNVKLGDQELRLPIVGYSNLPPRGASLPQAMRDGLALYLRTNEESLVLLHTATAMAHCRLTTNFDVKTISITTVAECDKRRGNWNWKQFMPLTWAIANRLPRPASLRSVRCGSSLTSRWPFRDRCSRHALG